MAVSEAKKQANARYQAKTIASLACRVKKDRAALFKAACGRIGKTPNAILTDAVNLVLAIDGPDGPTLAAITAAAQRERLSVNEWVLDAIRDKL